MEERKAEESGSRSVTGPCSLMNVPSFRTSQSRGQILGALRVAQDMLQNTDRTERNKRVQMKRDPESRMDVLVRRIGELANAAKGLAHVAVQQYSAEVEAIQRAKSRDSRRIERCLDGMLDFCFDHDMLMLYKKLCRYYFDIDPEATGSYVHTYREMWDQQESDKRNGQPSTKKGPQRGRRGKSSRKQVCDGNL